MERNADTETSMTPVAEKGQKNGNGLKIATAIACVVAVCGIGFGIYGMVQNSQKDNQIAELNSEIMQLKQSIEELKTTIEDADINKDMQLYAYPCYLMVYSNFFSWTAQSVRYMFIRF